jgi:diguanylate cyclase (GGDEF)-like protein
VTERLDEESVEAWATGLGVLDALLFRRVSRTRWAHLGGLGRGRGWAGIVDVDSTSDRLATHVPAEPGTVARFAFTSAGRVLGPYYARTGALVRVSNDVLVVVGNQQAPDALPGSDAELLALAGAIDAQIADVTPSKRLGDELEVLHAVRKIITAPAATLPEMLKHIVTVSVESLSCDVGVLRDGRNRMVVVDPTGTLSGDTPGLTDALNELHDLAGSEALSIQDVAETPGLALHRLVPGLCSVLVLTVPQPVGGVFVAGHTSAGPRGFTTLCRYLGEQVIEAGSIVAHTAALRDDLGTIAAEQAKTARTDPLTGLSNRLRWDEAVAEAQRHVDAGASITIITLDLDGLKEINDTLGHEAGDLLLRRTADILRDHCRDDDIIARLGGDEFAVLLPVDHSLAQQRITALTAAFSSITSDHQAVAASVGTATVNPGQRIVDAVRNADMSMYAQKRLRRARSRMATAAQTAGSLS